MWFIGVELEQETSAPPPKENPGSAPEAVEYAAAEYSDSTHDTSSATSPIHTNGVGGLLRSSVASFMRRKGGPG